MANGWGGKRPGSGRPKGSPGLKSEALAERLDALGCDPAHEPELVDARTRLAQSETSMRELGAAEQLAQRMAREAQQRALQTSCISPKQRRG